MWFNRTSLVLVGCLLLGGCATVNFSANYYTPPDNYQVEVKKEWDTYLKQAALLNNYNLEIVSDRGCMNGIPEITGVTVKMPQNFIKYVYQNYYDDRFKVLLCVESHEICHNEYRLFDQSSPQAHFQVDQKAIELLRARTILCEDDYYKSLFVVKDYWFARKGVGGHFFNLGWNMVNAASIYYGGPSYFRDWFATDLNKRMALFARRYNVRSGSKFQRSSGYNRKISLEKEDFADIFLAKKSE